MPTTSTAINACGVTILMDDGFGNLVDISGSANEANLDFDNDLGEFKVFGDRAKYRLECGLDSSLDFTAIYTTGLREAADLVKSWRVQRGQRRIRICVPRNVSGADAYEGYFFYEKVNIPLKSDEAKPIMSKVNAKPNGEVNYFKVP